MSRPELAVEQDAATQRRNQLGQTMGAKGVQTRRRLLQATELLLNTTPLRDLTVAQIVRGANTSTATFYIYFSDVSEAVLALIGELTQSPPNLLAVVGQPWVGEGADDRAHEFVAAYVERWQSHAPAFRLRNLASDEGDARFTELRINAVSPLLTAMAARIEERQVAGGLTTELHPLSTAGALLAMIERMAAMHPPGEIGVTRPRLLHVAAFFTVLVLGDGKWKRLEGPDAHDAGAADDKPSARLRRVTRGPTAQLNQQGQAMGQKGVRTRDRFIEATIMVLRSQSLLDLTVARIAKLAGRSTATFYLYFEDASEALLAAIKNVSMSEPNLLACLEATWSSEARDREAYDFVSGYIERWRENRAIFRARNLAADEGDERFIRARADAVRGVFDLMLQRVAECQSQGRLPADLHPGSAAAGCLAMIERLAASPNINSEKGVTLETVARAASYFLSVLMSGLPIADAPSRPIRKTGLLEVRRAAG